MVPRDVVPQLDTLHRHVQQTMVSEGDFSQSLSGALDSLPSLGLAIKVVVQVSREGGPHETIATYGDRGGEDGDALSTMTNEKGSFRFVLAGRHCRGAKHFDPHQNREAFQEMAKSLTAILEEHWGHRDAMTLLPRFSDSGQRQRIDKAVRDACMDGGPVTVVHLDLDHFKQVNTEFGESGGDAVLQEFGSRIRQWFGELAVAVRKGGEEFSLFFPRAGLMEVLGRAEQFRQMMAATTFEAIGRSNNCSLGLASYPAHVGGAEPPKGWCDALLNAAMAAEKRAKDEGRNRIRLASSSVTAPTADGPPIQPLDLTECTLWARQRLDDPMGPDFGNEIHSFLARHLAAAFEHRPLDALTEEVERSLQAFGIEIDHAREELDYLSRTAVPRIHPVKLACVTVHALLRLAICGKGPLRVDDRLHLVVTTRGSAKHLCLLIRRADGTAAHVPLAQMPAGQVEFEEYAGQPWVSGECASGSAVGRRVAGEQPLPMSPVLLVAIGQSSLELGLRPWVAGVVEIDDRPVTGGGLPDFWQSNISRVIYGVLSNPNVCRIVVVGDPSKAARTLDVLERPESIPPGKLAKRLSIDVTDVDEFRSRKVVVHRTPAQHDRAVESLKAAYFADEASIRSHGAVRDVRAERQKQRRIKASGFAPGAELQQADGMRCRTMAEAYPRVIHLLRSVEGAEHCDHMSRRFRELTGFKLVLEVPLTDDTPDYWSQEVQTLEDYYTKQFLEPEGLFSQALKGPSPTGGGAGLDQIQEAVKAATKSVTSKVSSRRIIMLAPHPGGDWQRPMGLVCAHIVPRLVGDRWALQFQWVWRTVEALVGLPFSAYASIRQSREILEGVNAAITEQHMQVDMGELVYVALSLHMFLDEGDRDIARTIVLDAYE